ncbi:MAG: single-stranded DNA-binding protein [Bdellovibrionales bacterium]|nr:single-stranded DNA-binding protein [Bdellovibrionales bacterium]
MAGINKVIIIGNLGKDPELRHTPQGQAVATFSVATSESWNDKTGQKQERTEWHRIVVWGKQAELCSKYLSKGRKAYIEGRLQTRAWDDKEGQKRYTTEIVANTVQFLDSAGGSASRGGMDAGHGGGEDPFGAPPEFDNHGGGSSNATDDIPF